MENNNSPDNIDFNDLLKNGENTENQKPDSPLPENKPVESVTEKMAVKKSFFKKNRLWLIPAILLLVPIGIIGTFPLFFKDSLLNATKKAIRDNANVEVNFGDFNLSLLKSFPKVTLELGDVKISGKGDFQNDSLLSIRYARTKLSLMSLFHPEGMTIEEIYLIQPDLKLKVNKKGMANWDVFPESEKTVKPVVDPATDSGLNLKLDKIRIKNGIMSYDDKEIDLYLLFNDLNMELKGEMYGNSTELRATGKAEKFDLIYESIKYISNVTLETKTLFNVDYDKMDIIIKENELMVNRLPLEVLGKIQMPNDSMFFDLSFKSKESGFENFLALIPEDYEKYTKSVKTSGNATVAGKINGLYYNEIYPEFNMDIQISDGNLKYADMPEEIKNIKGNIRLFKPEGDLDLTVLKIKDAHAQIRNNPVDLTLTMSKLMTDPYFDGAFIGKIDFDQLKDALPLDSINLSGIIDANLFVKGNYSSIENENYENIRSEGIVLLNNFNFESKDFNQSIVVPQGKLDFSPQNVNLSQFEMQIGQSKISLQGKVSNYLNYVFKDGDLMGDLQLKSDFVNLDELLRLQNSDKSIKKSQKENETANPSPTQKSVENLTFDIPSNVDISFRSVISKALFDKLNITNINGLITAKNGKLILNGLNMRMLDGEITLTGSYQNNESNRPLFDFGFDISKIDIPLAFKELTFFRNMAPIAGKSQGKLSTNLKINGQLEPDLKLTMTSIQGLGLLTTEGIRIIDSPVMKELKGILKADKLKKVEIDDFKANFVVENGSLILKPFTTRIAEQETIISGWINAQNLINMKLDFKIDREAFGTEIQTLLALIPGNSNISIIPASVYINGPVGDPGVKLDLSEAKKTITDQVKKSTKENLQNTLDRIGSGIKKFIK